MKNTILNYLIHGLIGIGIGIAIFFSADIASASVLWNDEFSYSTGDLNGNGGWYTDDGNNSMVVSATQSRSPSTSIVRNSATSNSIQDIATSTGGIITFHFYADNTPDNGVYVGIGDGWWTDRVSVWFKNDGKIYLEGDSDPEIVASYDNDTWHEINFEYFISTTTDDWIRMQFDEEEWSATTTITGSGFDSTKYIHIYSTATNGFYIDDISLADYSEGGSSSCGDYFTEEDCLDDEDCSWWDIPLENPYLTAYYVSGICVETAMIPEGFSTTTYAYITEEDCTALGYCWYPGSGCYVCDPTMSTTSDYALHPDIQNFIQDPGSFLSDAINYFDIRKKFPVGWVFEIYSAWSSTTAALEDSTSSAATIYSVDVPIGNWSTTTITFLNFAWITDGGVLETPYQVYYTIATYGIWFAFTWKMWRKVKGLSENINKFDKGVDT